MSDQELVTSIRISQYAVNFIEEPAVSKVHSVFMNGLNLQLNNGNLLFISKDTAPLSSYGLVMEESVFDTIISQIKVDQMVRIKKNELTFYTRPNIYSVELSDVQVIDLTPPFLSIEKLKESGLTQILEELDVLEQSGFSHAEGLKNLYNQWIENETEKEILAQQLIGAGIGLTPTGDDFLQGLLVMEHVLQQPDRLKTIVESELENKSTTDVSRAYYKALFTSQVNELWLKLFQLIKEEEWEEIEPQVEKIQLYGHTSGNDLLTGILTYLQTYA